MENIAKAIIAVMRSVKGIDKTMTIGTGIHSYKGVPDKEVKKIIGDAMALNGLCILPIGIETKTQIDRWEETGGQYGPKQKQSVFTEATTKYLLLHESGESIELAGYGHGIDSQDKGAGKATTYALKYTLLYLFLVPTGKIDDSDNTHSDVIETPQKKVLPPADNRPTATQKLIDTAVARINAGELDIYAKTISAFKLSASQTEELEICFSNKNI